MNPAWYWRRLSRMAPSEVVGRARDAVVRRAWRHLRSGRRAFEPRTVPEGVRFVGVLPPLEPSQVPPRARERLLSAAEDLLNGRWDVFGSPHPAIGANPDWFVDARSGRRAPKNYAFDIPYRNEERVGNIKFIWEPSRHHHLTVLAAAYAVTGDERFARRIVDHLQSWWRENPFLIGPHWISGIEIGIRLISWVWVRRLLHGWPGAAALFEESAQFRQQLYHHQRWLSTLPSRPSSANNHLVAEGAGQFVAASAFPIFKESRVWQSEAADVLQREAVAQTFASGINRELATDYQGLVLELCLAAAVEGGLSGRTLGPVAWERILAMTDALASILDSAGQPPRQGDGDDASGLLLDHPAYNRWNALLSTGQVLFGRLPWWPAGDSEPDLRTVLWTRGIDAPALPNTRPPERPNLFTDAGQAFLRTKGREKEVWCRCEHGPHGFLSIAAHAHADALAIELRVDGTDILADPGTYCYHGEAEWRRYFRSTIGHNTLELLAQDQSISGGPFLWISQAQSRLVETSGLNESAPRAIWRAEHSGYVGRGGPVHERTVVFDRQELIFTVSDKIHGGRIDPVPARLALHLGPSVQCQFASTSARLSWPGGGGVLELPDVLTWSLHRGEIEPPLGWYSNSFGVKTPAVALIGSGNLRKGTELVTRLRIS